MMPQTPPFDLVVGMDRSDRKVNLHQLDRLSGQEQASVLSTDPAALQAWAATWAVGVIGRIVDVNGRFTGLPRIDFARCRRV